MAQDERAAGPERPRRGQKRNRVSQPIDLHWTPRGRGREARQSRSTGRSDLQQSLAALPGSDASWRTTGVLMSTSCGQSLLAQARRPARRSFTIVRRRSVDRDRSHRRCLNPDGTGVRRTLFLSPPRAVARNRECQPFGGLRIGVTCCCRRVARNLHAWHFLQVLADALPHHARRTQPIIKVDEYILGEIQWFRAGAGHVKP